MLDKLGGLLEELHALDEAREHLERALKINETTHGANDPSVASSMLKLGRLLTKLGDLEQARVQFEGALSIIETAYGADNIHVAVCLNSLGGVLHDLGQLTEAQTHYQRALVHQRSRFWTKPSHSSKHPEQPGLGPS